MDLCENPSLDWRRKRHPWELARVRFVAAVLRPWLTGSAGTALDVGCGDAWVVAQLAQRFKGWRFHGVDPELRTERLQSVNRTLAGTRVQLHRSLEDIPCGPGSLDLVLLLDVLEHVQGDAAFLYDLMTRPAIADRALLLVTVPACPHLMSSHDRILGHHRRYGLGSLCTLTRRVGLQTIECGTFLATGVAARVADLVLERLGMGRNRTDTAVAEWNAGAAFSAALARIIYMDAALGRALSRFGCPLPGLSCYSLCRK